MLSILFASADGAARDQWRQALQTAGCRVVTAAAGAGATESLEGLDAIIVDVEAAVDWRHVRAFADARPSAARLIVITSWSAPDGRYRRMAFGIGCDAFVTKPCSPETLVAVVDRLAAGERAIEAGGRR